MHPALLVSEIFCQIVLELSNEDLYSLSTTCHDLSEPALDQLWGTQSSLVPLINCLPKELLCRNELGVLSLNGTLTRADWDILLKYTHRIRHLKEITYDSSRCSYGWVPGVEKLSPIILKALSHPLLPTPSSLFPRLESLIWLDFNEEATSFLRTLSSVRVTSLDLGGFGLRQPSTTSFLEDVLHVVADLSVLFPALKSFTFPLTSTYSPHHLDLTSALSRAVCGWKDMRVLECGPLDTSAIQHLAHIPALESLTTSFPIYGLQSSDNLQFSETAFSCLRALNMRHACGFTQVIDFFEAIPGHLPALSHLTLEVDCLDGQSDIQRLYDAISRHIHAEALRVLSITQEGILDLRATNTRWTFPSLRPTLVFAHLESVSLTTHCSVSLTDSELLALADAWPQLKSLKINQTIGWISPSSVTISGLAAALERWTLLRDLALAIDAGEASANAYLAEGSPCRRGAPASLTELDLLDSRIEDNHEAVGTCLANVLASAHSCQVVAWDNLPSYGPHEAGQWEEWCLAINSMTYTVLSIKSR